MITDRFRNQLFSSMNGRYVTSEDFILSSEERYSKKIIIKYRYDSKIVFNIEYDGDDNLDRVVYSPGSMLKSETQQVSMLGEILKFIGGWISNIDQEFKVTPIVRMIDEHSDVIDKFQKFIDGFEGLDDKFSEHELEDLKEKLNDLEEKLEIKIRDDIEKESEQNSIIEKLKKDIVSLGVQSNNLTKKNWALSFITKMYLFSQKHPKLTRLFGTTVYSYLPEDIKAHLPEETVNVFLPDVEEQTDIES